MTIRTNPPGALVYVDDYEIGTTPVSTNFTYYGKRKIRIVKDGYETLTVCSRFRPLGTSTCRPILSPRIWFRAKFAISELSIISSSRRW